MKLSLHITITVKSPALWPTPPAVLTLILPVEAPSGTVATTSVDELETITAFTPPIVTPVASSRSVPVIVTLSPGSPLSGENESTTGIRGSFPPSSSPQLIRFTDTKASKQIILAVFNSLDVCIFIFVSCIIVTLHSYRH